MPVNTSDVDAFARRLRKAAGAVEVLESEWQDKWGTEIAQDMAGRAPRDTGALASSIGYDGQGTVTVGVDYGIFVEYGTTRTAPQPFARPSVDQNRPEASRDAVKRAVKLI